MSQTSSTGRFPGRLRSSVGLPTFVLLLVTALLAGCGRGDGGPAVQPLENGVETGLPPESSAVRGGVLAYAVEAETDPAGGGYCLPDAQLVTSGIQVARAFYDPLVVPDDSGGYVPYLARSVEPDPTHTRWTIVLREGVEFHDGSPLDATVVKNNLDAYRGEYPQRSSILMARVFSDIESVEVGDDLTVVVNMARPWVAFPASLYGAGRVGMIAQAQLDAPAEACATRPIGTGPFVFDDWVPGRAIRGSAFDGYWQIAPDGEPYPYLDAIEFRPMSNSDARVAALQQGEIDMMHTSTPSDMAGSLRDLRDSGRINLVVSDIQTESEHLIINSSGGGSANPILASADVRRAIAMAIDRARLNEEANAGLPVVATGPIPPGVMGHVEDAEAPGFDPEAAARVVADLEESGEDLSLRLLTSTSPSFIEVSALEEEMLEAVGFEVTLDIVDESDLVNRVIAGDYDLSSMRNQPGDDPDANAYWWWSGDGNLLNFGRFADAEIDEHLDVGRESQDPQERREAYEAIYRRFVDQQYNVYLWWAPWAVAQTSNVHGVLGPDLPDGSRAPGRLVTGHPLIGIWIER